MEKVLEQSNSTELSPSDAMALREQIQAEVFEGKSPSLADELKTQELEDAKTSNEEKPETQDQDDEKKEDSTDPDTDSSQTDEPDQLSQIIKSLQQLNTNISGMEGRLKQTERRIGGITNELSAAKKVAEDTKKIIDETPTPAEVQKASENQNAWNELKESFPDWAKAIEAKITESTKGYVQKGEIETLRQNLSKEIPKTETDADPLKLEKKLISIIHPDWQDIRVSPEYASWLSTQPIDIQNKATYGRTAEEAIDVLNRFQKREVKPKTQEPDLNKKKKAERLAQSELPGKKHSSNKPKSEADMTLAEIRAKVEREVFGK